MDREGGFIVLHRRIRSWPLWYFMTAEQRMVWVTVLLDANWKDSEAWAGTRRFLVKRGQLLHSENTIARHAGVGRKVVRTTIAKLEAEGAIRREPASRVGQVQNRDAAGLGTLEGQSPGPMPCLLTVVNYAKYQDVKDEAGPTPGPQSGQGRAKRGPSEGQAGALSEQEEPLEQEEPPTSGAAAPRRQAANGQRKADPRHHPIRTVLASVYAEVRRGAELPWGKPQAKQLANLLETIPNATVEEFERRWRYALGLRQFPGCSDALTFFKRWADLVPGMATTLPLKPPVTAPASPPASFAKGGPVAI